jgi:hypothetical protein
MVRFELAYCWLKVNKNVPDVGVWVGVGVGVWLGGIGVIP